MDALFVILGLTALVLVGIGRLAWPRRRRPAASRSLRADLAAGVAAVRGYARSYADGPGRILSEMTDNRVKSGDLRP